MDREDPAELQKNADDEHRMLSRLCRVAKSLSPNPKVQLSKWSWNQTQRWLYSTYPYASFLEAMDPRRISESVLSSRELGRSVKLNKTYEKYALKKTGTLGRYKIYLVSHGQKSNRAIITGDPRPRSKFIGIHAHRFRNIPLSSEEYSRQASCVSDRE